MRVLLSIKHEGCQLFREQLEYSGEKTRVEATKNLFWAIGTSGILESKHILIEKYNVGGKTIWVLLLKIRSEERSIITKEDSSLHPSHSNSPAVAVDILHDAHDQTAAEVNTIKESTEEEQSNSKADTQKGADLITTFFMLDSIIHGTITED